MTADPIAKKLDEEWTPYVIHEEDVAAVRTWLRTRDTANLKLYLSTFQETLDEKHRARAALLREELERRQTPPPDRIKEIFAALRSNWLVAVIIVGATTIGGIIAFKNNLCETFPQFPVVCREVEPSIDDIFGG